MLYAVSVLVVCLISAVHGQGVTVNISNLATYAGSYWNDEFPAKALDGAACYKGGAETSSYWKVVLPETVTVKQVKITGSYHGDLRVRLGPDTSIVGDLRGHDSNRLCRKLDLDGNLTSHVFNCEQPRTGSVLSISGESTPPGYITNLVLCDVTLYR